MVVVDVALLLLEVVVVGCVATPQGGGYQGLLGGMVLRFALFLLTTKVVIFLFLEEDNRYRSCLFLSPSSRLLAFGHQQRRVG